MENRKLTDREWSKISAMRKQCIEDIAPYIKITDDIHAAMLPEIRILDGNPEIKYNYTPDQQNTLDLIREAIECINKRYKKLIHDTYSHPGPT